MFKISEWELKVKNSRMITKSRKGKPKATKQYTDFKETSVFELFKEISVCFFYLKNIFK